MTVRLVILLCLIWWTACSPISKNSLNKEFRETEKNFHDHTGFTLYDLQQHKTVFDYNGSSYFTPASNTKIFTFYTALTTLHDSVPALRYVEQGDSLIFWGTGDPSLLYHKVFTNDKVITFLSDTDKTLYFAANNYQTTHFGAGWAWDDYNDYYSAERSPLPIYGNLINVQGVSTGVQVKPNYYNKFIVYNDGGSEQPVVRNTDSNLIAVTKPLSLGFAKELPAKISVDVTIQLLSDTLKKIVQPISMPLPAVALTLFSVPADSLYKVMMQESDNFIAEQLLLVSAGIMSDTLKPEIAIRRMKQGLLKDLLDEPIWFDGSGLSRYNLFTPRSVVQLWEKIYSLVPRERLFQLLAIGGKAGTIKNWYQAPQPFIFGKTGSLSNNHCLSGFIVTRSGKTLIFSFMNSNFATSSTEVRKNMQKILTQIYENY